jgi:hypothetical protein
MWGKGTLRHHQPVICDMVPFHFSPSVSCSGLDDACAREGAPAPGSSGCKERPLVADKEPVASDAAPVSVVDPTCVFFFPFRPLGAFPGPRRRWTGTYSHSNFRTVQLEHDGLAPLQRNLRP